MTWQNVLQELATNPRVLEVANSPRTLGAAIAWTGGWSIADLIGAAQGITSFVGVVLGIVSLIVLIRLNHANTRNAELQTELLLKQLAEKDKNGYRSTD